MILETLIRGGVDTLFIGACILIGAGMIVARLRKIDDTLKNMIDAIRSIP